MSLHVLFGRSSLDHEAALRAEMQAKLSADPAAELFYLVPNHIKFESEINVLERLSNMLGHHGAALAVPHVQVFSLSRLAWYYMQDTPLYRESNLSGDGLNMLVQYLLQEGKAELQLYHTMLHKQGFISKFADQLVEIRQSGLDWSEVTEIADALEDQKTLQMKLYDLALIGPRLDAMMQERGQYLSSDLLVALKVYLNSSQVDLSKHHFYINRYSQMTQAEKGIVEALIQHAGSVTIALPADSGSSALREPDLDEQDLFFRPKRLGRELKNFAQKAQVEVTVSGIEAPRTMSQTMTAVEQFWIDYEQQGVAAEVPQHDRHDLQVWQATTPYQEVEQMARLIRQEVAAGKHRYKDYILMARSLGQYGNIVPAVFERMGIPFYMDADHSMKDHPLVVFLDHLLRLAPNYRLTDIMALLKTELLRPDHVDLETYREALAVTENFALAKNLQGYRWLDATPWRYDQKVTETEDEVARERVAQKDATLALIHDQISQTVGPFLARLAEGATARELAREVYQFLEDVGIPKRLLEWRDLALEAGQLTQAQQPEQVWRTFIQVLDDFVTVFDDTPMTLGQLQELIKAGFDSANYTGVPATMDQVRISESGIVQGEGYHTAIIFGANKDQLPGITSTKSILDDRDRDFLNPQLREGVVLRETAEQQMAQETLLMYSAMMSANQRLIWVYATSNGDKETDASAYVERVREQFKVPVQRFWAQPDSQIQDLTQFVGSPQSTLGHLIVMQRLALQNEQTPGANWQRLSQTLQSLAPAAYQRITGSLSYHNEAAQVHPQLVQQLLMDPQSIAHKQLKLSVSRLQTYAKNPYEFFLQYALKLKERDEMTLSAAEKGTLTHALFEKTFQTLMQQDLVLGAVAEDQLRQIVMQEARYLLQSDDPTYDIFNSSERLSYTANQLVDQVYQGLLRMRRGQYKGGKVKTRQVELNFGLGQPGLAAVKYPLTSGFSLSLRGKIDRYDHVETPDDEPDYATIIDYKSSERKFDFQKALAGLEVQLMTYWAAMGQTPGLKVGGAVYWNAQVPWISAEKELKEKTYQAILDEASEFSKTAGRYRGIVRNDAAYLDRYDLVDNQLEILDLEKKSDGKSFKSAKAPYTDEEIQTLQTMHRLQVSEMAEQMLAGQYPIRPYRKGKQETGLQYTDYQAVMLFDALVGNTYQDISDLPTGRREALAKMAQYLEETGQE